MDVGSVVGEHVGGGDELEGSGDLGSLPSSEVLGAEGSLRGQVIVALGASRGKRSCESHRGDRRVEGRYRSRGVRR